MPDNLTSHDAGQYDTGIRKTIPFYDEIYNQTIDLVKTFNPEVLNWLDTGCGTGTFVLKAASYFPGCTFFLNDPSEKMLEICRNKVTGKNFQIIGCYSTNELPTKQNSYEVITAIQSHHYLSSDARLETSYKCFSLLKPGGMYITFENYRPQSNVGIKLGLDRWVNFQKACGKTTEEASNHRKRYDKEYFPITIGEHFKVLHESGFEICEVFWLSYMQAGFYAVKRKQ
jgi:tRNA (cmo5U34)-methyltransferase